MARKNAIVADILAHDEEVYRPAGIELVKGDARFSDELTIEVDGERVRGERVVIACGPRSRVRDIPGFRELAITSEDAIGLPELPRRVFILGGGVVGTELAQLFASAGAHVVPADRGERLVDAEDPEVSDAFGAALRAQGVDLRLMAALKALRPAD